MNSSFGVLPVLRGGLLARSVVAVVLAAFLLGLSGPLAAAERLSSPPGSGALGGTPHSGLQLVDLLREVRSNLDETRRGLQLGRPIEDPTHRLKMLRSSAVALDVRIRSEFAGIEALLEGRELPPEALDRHRTMVQGYRKQMDELLFDLELLHLHADSDALLEVVERISERLPPKILENDPRPFDPSNMPHGPQQPVQENLPRVSSDEYARSGLFDMPPITLAALDGYRLDGLPDATYPAFLAENPAVQLTPAVLAQAEALRHDPVAIYHWVRNEVAWIPTWGALQNSDLTLSARGGNAMDIAGLLIALLRASGIPARYVHGTIDISEAQFRNWAGGFAQVEEAMGYAASGGIPITGLVAGGRVASVRMEHVWVEAAIDFLPSRGAVMREADTWLPLDAAFKQYDYTAALDFAAATGMDAAEIARDFLDSGTLSENREWIEGLDSALLDRAQERYSEKLRRLIDTLDQPTIGDVIGDRRTVIRESAVLPSGLPYQRVVEGARYHALPGALGARIGFAFGDGLPDLETTRVEFPWVGLNNRKVTLSFRPATFADEEILRGLLPDDALIDFVNLPDRIPAYLIQMVPELKVDGDVVLTGQAVGLGSDVSFTYSVTVPVFGTRHYPNRIAAGSFLSVGVIGHQVSLTGMERVGERLGDAAAALAAGGGPLFDALDREVLFGELFHAGLLSYFAQLGSVGRLSAEAAGGHYQPTTSVGTFGYVPKVRYLFGVPHSIASGNVVMDLDRVAHIASSDGQGREAWTSLNIRLGALASALEHAVPEQMFLPPGVEGEGVSTVKAMQMALAQGQRIYRITPENQSKTLPMIHHNSLAMNDIQVAVASGREVFVHTHPVQVPGWQGAGYFILDPSTGAGAWKITGGANGGSLEPPIGSVETMWSVLSEWGGDLGKVAAKSNTIFEHTKTVFDLVKTCSTKSAVAGIVSVTFVASGFALLGKAAVAYGAFVAIGYGAGAALAVSTVVRGWERSCRV